MRKIINGKCLVISILYKKYFDTLTISINKLSVLRIKQQIIEIMIMGIG